MNKFKQLAGLLAAFACPLPVQAYPPPTDPLVRIHYDFEVASYCSLVTKAVSDGFQSQLTDLLAQLQPDQETLNQARADAWQAAHEEWQNRGLGGFKAWCRNEGSESANRFIDG